MKKYLVWLLVPLIALLLVGCDQSGTEEEANLKTVYIGPEKVDCEAEGPQTCYQVRENPDDSWSLWYYEIDGFDFEPGYEYELFVSENQVENPPAGGSSITWTLAEVVGKTAVAGGGSKETAEVPDTVESEPASEDEMSAEPPAQLEFVPISVENIGVTTVAPADWPKIEDDPLLKDAWGPGQYRFVAFHAVTGDDVQEAMAQLLSTTVGELEAGTIEGEYWEEELGDHLWGMYAIENPEIGLVQTVSMSEQGGMIYVVSLFIETDQKDAVLTPVLENFAIEGEAMVDETEETITEMPTALVDTNWTLTAYDDGSGQLVTVVPDVEITALFAAEGRVSGSAGCNDYVSLFTVEGESVSISLPAMTREECVDPPGIMMQETGYLGGLTAVVSYEIEGDQLQLLDEEGQVILTFLSA